MTSDWKYKWKWYCTLQESHSWYFESIKCLALKLKKPVNYANLYEIARRRICFQYPGLLVILCHKTKQKYTKYMHLDCPKSSKRCFQLFFNPCLMYHSCFPFCCMMYHITKQSVRKSHPKRWAYSIPMVRCHRPHFQTWISLKPVGQSWLHFMCSITRMGERLHEVLGQNFSQLFLVWSFLYLQVTRTCIKSRMRSNFGQIGSLTMELAALECLKNFP